MSLVVCPHCTVNTLAQGAAANALPCHQHHTAQLTHTQDDRATTCPATSPTPNIATPPCLPWFRSQVRLLMCYSATHLEKLDSTREAQWQKVARLAPEDMAMVTNLEYLGVPGE